MTNEQTARALCRDLDLVFAGDRWALLAHHGTLSRIYVGAGVRHTAHLMARLQEAADRHDETVARILARAHVEAFIITLYLHLGGQRALDAIAADSRANVEAWAHDVQSHNTALAAERRRVRKHNTRIRRKNRDREARNAQRPDLPALELFDEEPEPKGEPIELDFADALAARSAVAARRLSLRTVVSEVSAMLHADGDPASMEVAYNYAYRSLSALGAHTGLRTLDSYIVDRDRTFVRIAAESSAPVGATGSAYVAIVMTAYLTAKALAREHAEGLLPTAERVLRAAEAAMHTG